MPVAAGLLYVWLAANPIARGDEPSPNSLARISRYVRASGAEFVIEAEIAEHTKGGQRIIRSRTGPLQRDLTLVAKYSGAQLVEAEVAITLQQKTQKAVVTGSRNRVHIKRNGVPETELDLPPNVIVTSAPDWTDAHLIVRGYDVQKAGRQTFDGLWIHPVQPPRRITFVATFLGRDSVRHDKSNVELTRLRLELRGGSRYVAWRNRSGSMVRLMPENASGALIVLAGWEMATEALRPNPE